MPFTLSHPAAILPLHRFTKRKDLLFPLAIGSMTPDIGYYLHGTRFIRENAHTLIKSFTFCLPAGLCALLIIALFKMGIRKLLPTENAKELFTRSMPEKISWQYLLLSAVCILVGSWTHIIWDGFTHRNGFIQYDSYKVVQHISTVVGAAVLIIFYRMHAGASKAWDNKAVLFCLVIGCISLAESMAMNSSHWFLFLTTFMRNFIILFVAGAIVLQFK